MAQLVVHAHVEHALRNAQSALRGLAPGAPGFLSDLHALHAFCRLWAEAWALSRACIVVGMPEDGC